MYVVGPPDTAAASEPPAVEPAKAMSAAVKPVTGSENVTVNRIGLVAVGSAWAAAWSMVTVGGVLSNVTDASEDVEALFVLAAASWATPAGTDAMTVPEPVMPVTVTVYADGPPETAAASVPPAVDPVKSMSEPVNPDTGSLKTTSNVMGPVPVGSA